MRKQDRASLPVDIDEFGTDELLWTVPSSASRSEHLPPLTHGRLSHLAWHLGARATSSFRHGHEVGAAVLDGSRKVPWPPPPWMPGEERDGCLHQAPNGYDWV